MTLSTINKSRALCESHHQAPSIERNSTEKKTVVAGMIAISFLALIFLFSPDKIDLLKTGAVIGVGILMITNNVNLKDSNKNESLSRAKKARNLALSEKMLDYVRSIGIFSPNYTNRFNQFHQSVFSKNIDEVVEYMENVKKTISEIIETENMKDIFLLADYTERHHIGCCRDMCLIAIKHAMIQKTKERVEMFSIVNGDHAFTVVGRERGSLPNDPTTWGGSAVICDFWTDEIFPVQEINVRLKNVVKTILDKNICFCEPELENYDPNKHILTSSIDYPGCFSKKDVRISFNKKDFFYRDLFAEKKTL